MNKQKKKNIEVEVCTFSLESCSNAQNGGADRIELCTAMFDGGTTPSAAMIQMAREILSIQLYVMIRPRGGDFLYTDLEFEQMKREILFAKESNADGIVIGLLTKDGKVDVKRTRELVELASPLKVTFHRAIDMTVDILEGVENIIEAGCHRILTSAGQNLVKDGLETLKKITKLANERIEIMAGSGVNNENALEIINCGVDALHLSGKNSRDSEMIFRNENVFMGGIPDLPEYLQYYTDTDKIKAVTSLIK